MGGMRAQSYLAKTVLRAQGQASVLLLCHMPEVFALSLYAASLCKSAYQPL